MTTTIDRVTTESARARASAIRTVRHYRRNIAAAQAMQSNRRVSTDTWLRLQDQITTWERDIADLRFDYNL